MPSFLFIMGRPMLTEQKTEFLAWVKMSKQERKAAKLPLTFKAFAKSQGVSIATLMNWNKNGDTPPKENVRTAKVITNLYNQSEKSPLAEKLYLQAVGAFTEKSESKVEVGIAPDDCIRIASIVADTIRIYDLGRGSNTDNSIEGEGRLLPEPVCVDTE